MKQLKAEWPEGTLTLMSALTDSYQVVIIIITFTLASFVHPEST